MKERGKVNAKKKKKVKKEEGKRREKYQRSRGQPPPGGGCRRRRLWPSQSELSKKKKKEKKFQGKRFVCRKKGRKRRRKKKKKERIGSLSLILESHPVLLFFSFLSPRTRSPRKPVVRCGLQVLSYCRAYHTESPQKCPCSAKCAATPLPPPPPNAIGRRLRIQVHRVLRVHYDWLFGLTMNLFLLPSAGTTKKLYPGLLPYPSQSFPTLSGHNDS